METIIYARDSEEIPVYEQFNQCASYAKRYGYYVSGKVLDFDGTHFHEAINKVIVEHDIEALMIYSKDIVFPKIDDYLFYRIYLEKLNKKLIIIA